MIVSQGAYGDSLSEFRQPNLAYDEAGKLYTGTDEGTFEDGIKYKTSYKEGKANGPAKYTFPDGSYMEVNFVNGNAEGQLKRFYPSGKVQNEFYYKNGLMEGEQNHFTKADK